MAHVIGLRRSQGGVRALASFAIGLSLIFFTAVEGAHAHEDLDPPGVCPVCQIGHEGVPTPVADGSVIVEADLVLTPEFPRSRVISGVLHLAPHRSRAPPLSISL